VVLSLSSTAAAVSSSPNTQLILARLVMQPAIASAVGTTYAWPHVLNVLGSPLRDIPYFDNPVTDPVLIGP
jgi:hypothetical protein